jgi:arylsulfatase A-like enzyme
MRTFAPDVMAVDFGEIDCAHYGSWSRYVDAIRRTDELTWRIWRATEDMDEYRGRTLLLILPDHGRELDRPGHWGFIHHSNFYTNQGADEGCRRVWMLAVGPDVKAGRKIEKPVPITTVATTGLEFLGLEASKAAEDSAWDIISL